MRVHSTNTKIIVAESLSKNALRDFVVLLIVLFSSTLSFAQNVVINANNKPLSDVLIELRDNYNVQISFNHQLVSKCLITHNKTYASAQEAIESIIKKCNLAIENSYGVLIVYEEVKIDSTKKTKAPAFMFSGQLIDALSTEPLPFSSIQNANNNLIADANGNFSFKTTNKLEQLKISHLGYFILDTTLVTGSNQKIYLTPSVIGLNEVFIKSETKIFTAHIGEKPGLIKVNKKVASFLPGNNNNTIFNLLRLQPGIIATAEQSGDYIIWGSYKGQNLLLYDGIPLFSANSLNNEIGVINPLMVKDIEVYKGGYNVDKGDRVGGLIQMTGTSGNSDDISLNVNVNSQTVSGAINVPVFNKLAFQAAFRQTYYDVVDWSKTSTNDELTTKQYYEPDYDFRDLNFKLSGKNDQGTHFYVSLLGNNDESSFNVEDEGKFRGRAWENETQKQQLGATAHVGKNWNNGGITNISATFSKLQSSSLDRENFRNRNGNNTRRSFVLFRENAIEEQSLKVKQVLQSKGIHNVELGLSIIENSTYNSVDSVQKAKKTYHSNYRCGFYLKDRITLGNYFEVQPGLRYDYFPELSKAYLQPRINGLVKPVKGLKVNLAFGVYNQYITEMNMFDRLGNMYYFWGLSDNSVYKLVSGIHRIVGVSYKHNGFNIGVEGYFKTAKDLSRFTFNDKRELVLAIGKSQAKGIDCYIKKQFNKHDFWLSYSLSRAEEDFFANKDEYVRASHDQTHEIKGAAILNFKPWYISTNYVYGSGLHSSKALRESEAQAYHRLDIAFLYKFKTKTFNLEAGLSVVNVLNYENIGYTGFAYLPDKSVYAKGTPFTPSVFVNIGF